MLQFRQDLLEKSPIINFRLKIQQRAYYYYYYYYYSKVLSILKYSLNDAAVRTSSMEKVTNYQFQTENLPAFRLSVRWLDYSSGKRKEDS